VILIAGIADESPTSLVVDALEAIGANFRVFDQRRVGSADFTLEIAGADGGGAVGGSVTVDGETIALPDITGLYLRVMDDRFLPGIATLRPDSAERTHCHRFHDLLNRFADIMPGRVLNRPAAMASNHSKPYQAQGIRAAGFDVPDTLITNDPSEAQAFIEHAWTESGDVIYKSISGVRSIVEKVARADLPRLDRIRWCPTQFQRLVTGTDIRVHVIGQTVMAVAIVSDATDYRYAARQTGIAPAIERVELDARLRTRCVGLAQSFDLPLAGIDLRRTPDGRHVCFEVNPSPAFSFYEQRADVPIASCIARYLAGEAD
jgi:glutathione synthase/RimK-type ligase-like ATP-grasp enzyme